MKLRVAAQIAIAGLLSLSAIGCTADGLALSGGVAEPRYSGVPDGTAIVYYMHRTFRCASCKYTEKLTREALSADFPNELAAGRVRFEAADYQEREDLARCFDVNTPSVVLVTVSGGKAASHRTLDELWGLGGKPQEFRAALATAVRAALKDGNHR